VESNHRPHPYQGLSVNSESRSQKSKIPLLYWTYHAPAGTNKTGGRLFNYHVLPHFTAYYSNFSNCPKFYSRAALDPAGSTIFRGRASLHSPAGNIPGISLGECAANKKQRNDSSLKASSKTESV